MWPTTKWIRNEISTGTGEIKGTASYRIEYELKSSWRFLFVGKGHVFLRGEERSFLNAEASRETLSFVLPGGIYLTGRSNRIHRRDNTRRSSTSNPPPHHPLRVIAVMEERKEAKRGQTGPYLPRQPPSLAGFRINKYCRMIDRWSLR